MRRLIRVSTAGKYFRHISLGISESYSLTYLKFKFDSYNIKQMENILHIVFDRNNAYTHMSAQSSISVVLRLQQV